MLPPIQKLYGFMTQTFTFATSPWTYDFCRIVDAVDHLAMNRKISRMPPWVQFVCAIFSEPISMQPSNNSVPSCRLGLMSSSCFMSSGCKQSKLQFGAESTKLLGQLNSPCTTRTGSLWRHLGAIVVQGTFQQVQQQHDAETYTSKSAVFVQACCYTQLSHG